MKKIILLLTVLSIITFSSFSAVTEYYSIIGGGDWSSSATWALTAGQTVGGAGTPGGLDIVHVESSVTLDVDVTNPGVSLIISSSGSLIKKVTGGPYGVFIKSGGTFDISGNLNIDNLELKNGSVVQINSGATVSTVTFVDNGTIGMVVNGTLNAGTVLTSGTITGSGVVSAATYSVSTTLYGIAGASLSAATTYYGLRWTGTSTTAWETTGNWLNSTIPTSTQTAQIPGGLTNYPIIGSDVTINTVVVESGASVTINPIYSLTVTGTLTNNNGNSGIVIKSTSSGTGNLLYNTAVSGTVERYLVGSAANQPYHYISSPVNGGAFSSIWTSGDNNVYYYDESNASTDLDQGWTRISSGTLTNGKGYAVNSNYASGNRTMTFTGTLNAANLTPSVSHTSSGTAASDGWNLMGNPFPCALTAATFISENSSDLDASYQAVYYWDDANGDITRSTDYATRASTTGTSSAASTGSSGVPGDQIPLGQGFFVKVKTAITSLSFSTNQKSTNASAQFFVPDLLENLWISVDGPDNLYNEIALSFLPEASKLHDPLFDVVKLRGNPNIALYTFVENEVDQYVIQGLAPVYEKEVVKLGIHAGITGEYVFKIKDTENFSASTQIYLIDTETDKIIDLKNSIDYKVNLIAGEHNERFLLHFVNNANTAIQKELNAHMSVYSNQDRIHFINDDKLDGTAMIYDAIGQLIKEVKLDHTAHQVVSLAGYQGVAIVTVSNEFGLLSHKLFIK